MPDDAVEPPRRLSEAWLDSLARLIATSPVNLVSAADRRDVRRLHVDECVAIAEQIHPRRGAAWLDLGTGGGLPGLVLAGSYPAVTWTLLDARAKKVTQVRRFASELGLENVVCVHGRAEDLASDDDWRGAFDGVTSRAVGPIVLTVALSRGFVTTGWIVAVRGPAARDEAARLVRMRDELDVGVAAVDEISGTMRPTWLIRARGRGPVPERFPQVRQHLLRTGREGTQ